MLVPYTLQQITAYNTLILGAIIVVLLYTVKCQVSVDLRGKGRLQVRREKN